MSRSGGEWWRVTLLFTILTIAATWPQIVQPAGIPDNRDARLNMWRIAWIAHQVPRDPVHLFDANIHHPERATLAYSDATLMQGLIGSPWIWLGVPTAYVHTMLVMVSFVFAGVGAWALVRTLTGSMHAGVASGLIFAFTPYRFDHYMHLELLWTGWMPLTLLALHRAVDRQTVSAGVATGLLFAAQALSCIYYSIFFGTVLIVFIAVLASGLSALSLRRTALSLACGAFIAAALLWPYLAPYRQARVNVGDRSEGEVLLYSAGPKHYLSATPDNVVYGAFANAMGRPEKRLFPGVLALALMTAALWPPLTRRRAAYAAALLLAIDLSFGPNGLTYGWLREHVFPYRGLRAPARAGGVTLLMIAVLAGSGWARLERSRWLQTLSRQRLAAIGLLAAIAIEYVTVPRRLVAAPVRPEPVYEWLSMQKNSGVVAEFPMPDEHGLPLHDAEFMYRSTFHWHPLVNGYSGNVPASYVDVLRAVRTFPSFTALERLHQAGVRYIVVHERLLGSTSYRAATARLDTRSDLARHGPFGRAGEESTVYEMSAPAVHD